MPAKPSPLDLLDRQVGRHRAIVGVINLVLAPPADYDDEGVIIEAVGAQTPGGEQFTEFAHGFVSALIEMLFAAAREIGAEAVTPTDGFSRRVATLLGWLPMGAAEALRQARQASRLSEFRAAVSYGRATPISPAMLMLAAVAVTRELVEHHAGDDVAQRWKLLGTMLALVAEI